MSSTEEESEEGGEADSSDEETPTPQPDALRRQQTYAAIGGALLAGLAVAVSIAQRYPDYAIVALVAGVLCTYLVYRLASGSIFPGEETAAKTN